MKNPYCSTHSSARKTVATVQGRTLLTTRPSQLRQCDPNVCSKTWLASLSASGDLNGRHRHQFDHRNAREIAPGQPCGELLNWPFCGATLDRLALPAQGETSVISTLSIQKWGRMKRENRSVMCLFSQQGSVRSRGILVPGKVDLFRLSPLQ